MTLTTGPCCAWQGSSQRSTGGRGQVSKCGVTWDAVTSARPPKLVHTGCLGWHVPVASWLPNASSLTAPPPFPPKF